MANINSNFSLLSSSYLFPKIEEEVKKVSAKNPDAQMIHLGIGDSAYPLCPTIIKELHLAIEELSDKSSFKGYPPSEGYLFLREAIAENEYKKEQITPEEIFISDGAKSDLSHLQELLGNTAIVGLITPSYPVYQDTSVIYGRASKQNQDGTYNGIVYIPLIEEQNFIAKPPKEHCDCIYLCSPNNPTATAFSMAELQAWVDYALREKCLLLYDGAYCDFIQSSSPKSIYAIPEAKKVAIEIRSFSKSAGFTNLRLSYTVVPKDLQLYNAPLHAYWKRRVQTRFNGVSYPIQKAALSTYSSEGKKEIKQLIATYQENATLVKKGLEKLGITVYGGIDAPYLWCKTPSHISSWEFFLTLLQNHQIVTTPGIGFGKWGEGFIRISAFATKETVDKALQRMESICTTL